VTDQAAVGQSGEASVGGGPNRPRSFESRAAIACRLGVVLAVITALLSLPALGLEDGTAPAIIVSALGGVVLAVVLFAEANGLDMRSPWATAAARPLLALVVALAVVRLIVGLGQSRIEIPLDGFVAIWALSGPSELGDVRLGRRGLTVVGSYLAATVGLSGLGSTLLPGGLLDVQRSDLRGTIAVDCGPREGPPPAALAVTYRWSWNRGDPIATGIDAIVIGWSSAGSDADAQELYHVNGAPDPDAPDGGPGVVSGLSGGASSAQVQAIQAGGEPSWAWGVDLATQQYSPGEVHLMLRNSSPDAYPNGGVATIIATYVHQGAWQEQSDVTCSWSPPT